MNLIKNIFILITVVQFMHAAEINTTAQRDSILTAGRTILATNKEVIPTGEALAKENPFFRAVNPEIPEETGPTPPSGPTGVKLLEAIAAQIRPSGTFSLGGEPILLIGKLRYRIGDKLTVKFNSQSYDLILSSIERTNFSLKLGKFEVTRAITLNPTK